MMGVMALVLYSAIFLLILQLCETSAGGDPSAMPRDYRSASAQVRRICATICAEASMNRNITIVFVLYADPWFEVPLQYLWKFPSALIYLSMEPYVPRDRDREILISYERDFPPFEPPRESFWKLTSSCGYRFCQNSIRPIEHFRLERRVLIQIRELTTRGSQVNIVSRTRDALSGYGLANYFALYRRIFVIFRIEGGDRILSGMTIRRGGRIVSVYAMRLFADDFDMIHAQGVFESTDASANVSEKFDLHFNSIVIPNGNRGLRFVFFESCASVSSRWQGASVGKLRNEM